MKKKIPVFCLLFLGIALLILSLILPLTAAGYQGGIIGGAGISTYLYRFRRAWGGASPMFTLAGLLLIAVSVAVLLRKRKK